MTTLKTSDPLSGVECSVETCEFNQNGKKCTASSICVKPTGNATDLKETNCATFTAKDIESF